MFQYAFAREIAERKNDDITINTAHIADHGNGDPSFRNELSGFELSGHVIFTDTRKDQVLLHGSFLQKSVYKWYRWVRKIYGKMGKDPHAVDLGMRNLLSRIGIYRDNLHRASLLKIGRNAQKNTFIYGYFEDPVYFRDIRVELLDAFRPLAELRPCNERLLQLIQTSESVCVSFRKWEVNGREVCGKEYYEKAINYILEHVSNPVFVIFSNDVEWVKGHFELPANCLYEEENSAIYEKITLMSACRHFIITNSTFAWWAQYLGTADNKIVVSPSRWYEISGEGDPLIEDSFVKL